VSFLLSLKFSSSTKSEKKRAEQVLPGRERVVRWQEEGRGGTNL
jgi:hypothetical protein